MHTVYHSGERKVQQMVGEETRAQANGRIITNAISKGVIPFIEKQVMAIVSSAEADGNVWVSALMGDAGFTEVHTPHHIQFNLLRIYSKKEDIFFKNIANQPHIGTLFIELATRRRFRINGEATLNDHHIDIAVQEAYANCPKYIQRREVALPGHSSNLQVGIENGTSLTMQLKDWIAKADTLFVGSQSTAGRLDASHRGGNPGFVEILDDATLRIPDYSGNSMYNTLGNIAQNPKTGLLFIDFEEGSTLQLTGEADLLFDQHTEADQQKTGGTGRYWRFRIHQWIRTRNHHKVNWDFLDASPFNP